MSNLSQFFGGGRFPMKQFGITTSMTFTTYERGLYRLTAIGGGGGGGGAALTGNYAGGGGGAGGLAQSIYTLDAGVALTLTCGAAGTAGTGGSTGTDGTAGGNSSISATPITTLTANGGGGGGRGNGTVASGGTASGGNIRNQTGGAGGSTTQNSTSAFGNGGGAVAIYTSTGNAGSSVTSGTQGAGVGTGITGTFSSYQFAYAAGSGYLYPEVFHDGDYLQPTYRNSGFSESQLPPGIGGYSGYTAGIYAGGYGGLINASSTSGTVAFPALVGGGGGGGGIFPSNAAQHGATGGVGACIIQWIPIY